MSQKIAYVTGGMGGIGTAICQKLAKAGFKVIAGCGPSRDYQKWLDEQKALGFTFHASVGNVADWDSTVEAFQKAITEHGAIDVLVNNAGINVFSDPLKLSEDDWARCLSVDLEGAWHCARAVLPHMLARGAGSIVNIASVHGHKIIPGAFPYPVAKHGLIGLTRALGIEYAARGIRVNSISPGLILTPIAEAGFAAAPDPEAERRRQAELLPCKRIGEPEEVAYTALFLASDEARFINATDILIDGGRSQLYHE